MNVSIKTSEQIEKMRVAGKLAAQVLEMIEEYVKPGVSTEKLDKICHDYIINEQKAIPAPLNYHGFPKSICTSVNHVICHGIPSEEKILREGDILNIDVTVIKDGFHGDTSKMYYVGKPTVIGKRLVEFTQKSLYAAIDLVRPGTKLSDIGKLIGNMAKKERFGVVEEFCGHGIGEIFHEDPQILHYDGYNKQTDLVLAEGMTFTIEPMINSGKRHCKVLQDGWTAVTKDKSLSAQWEHTMVVTKDGCEIFTMREEERDYFTAKNQARKDQ